ncbi:MAG: alkaline phosphatase family protein, partial [Planctomycetota bacterium]|nr:alkaline phosphatase family protein [Planctomycetota bacterium]
TDNEFTVTLPNHIGMLTSRLTTGEFGHRYTANGTPPSDAILRDANGQKIDSIYNRTAAAHIFSSLNAAKSKFVIFEQSYKSQIDDFFISADGELQFQHFLNTFREAKEQRSFHLLHFMHPDVAGHLYGWNLSTDSKYMQAIAAVDDLLRQLLEWLDDNPEIAENTAIVLTSDHGGGGPHKNHHGIGHLWVNYIIPLFVWTGDGKAQGDLYEINAGAYLNPGLEDPMPNSESLPAIRNADVGNLCLNLLGLPPIKNSTRNNQQNIRIFK